MKKFIATVQILVESDTEINASDSLGEFLSESIQNGNMVDWEFLRVGEQLLYPTETLLERFTGSADPED